MLPRVLLTASIALFAVSLAAQAPEGWRVRVDHSRNAEDPDDRPDLKFVTMGKGFHVTGGPAGTFWNPAQAVKGDFTARATFTLMRPSPHVNYYGLIFGGGALEGASQTYIYFLVAQNGTYIVRHRVGEAVHDVQTSAPNPAVRQPDAKGQSTNTLEVKVAGNTITYAVNGMVVHSTPKTGMTAKTDGIVGVRVNHLLDVHIEGFQVQRQVGLASRSAAWSPWFTGFLDPEGPGVSFKRVNLLLIGCGTLAEIT